MQAIVTKYHGPTNSKGSRISAKCDAGSVTIPYPYELSGDEVYRAAANALIKKLGWTTENGYPEMCCGGLPNNAGYVFVFTSK